MIIMISAKKAFNQSQSDIIYSMVAVWEIQHCRKSEIRVSYWVQKKNEHTFQNLFQQDQYRVLLLTHDHSRLKNQTDG